jgi:hypothetical protein
MSHTFSSVSIVIGSGLDDRGSRFRFRTGAGNFSLHHRVQNGSGAHPASYPMCVVAFSLGIKRPRRALTTHLHVVPMELDLHSPIQLHGVVLI